MRLRVLVASVCLGVICALSVTLAMLYPLGGDQLAYITSPLRQSVTQYHQIVLQDIERGLALPLYRSEVYLYGLDWSPDGESIYFGSRHDDRFYSDLAVLDIATGEMRWLTDSADTDDVHPSVSPDGVRLVFQYFESGQTGWDIMLYDLASGDTQMLYQGISADTSPDWSSDGRFIAFETASVGRNSANVMVYDLQTETTTRLTTGMDGTPSWTPDGDLLFTSQQGNHFDVYRMDAHGDNRRRLTTTPFGSFDAIAHPDGERVVYVSWADVGASRRAAQLFLIDGDGNDPHPLSRTIAEYQSPAWRP